MSWNISLLVFLIFVEFSLYYVYKTNRKLPLIKNKLFAEIAILIFLTSFYSLAELTIGELFYPVKIQYYYIRIIILICMIEYIFSLIILYVLYYMEFSNIFYRYRRLFKMPLYVITILMLTSPWSGLIVTKNSADILVKGSHYELLYVVPLMYVGLFLYLVIKYKRDVKVKNIGAIWLVIGSSILGIVINYFTDSLIILSFSFTVTEYIMYITMCDPNLFRSRSTDTFNRQALMYTVNEFKERQKPLYLGGIKISNHQSVIERVGVFKFDESINVLTAWLRRYYPDIYVFYLGTQQLILMSETEHDKVEFLAGITQRLGESFNVEQTEIMLQGEVFSIATNLTDIPIEHFIICLDNLLAHTDLDPREVFVVKQENIEENMRQNQLKNILSKKIKEKDLMVYYQPLYSTKTQKITGAEALVRMYDEELGVIMPYKFIPLAESSGEILELGMIVFEKVCQYIQTHDLEEMGLEFININVSPLQFQDLQLVEKFKKIADWYGVDLSLIEFEITESVILKEQLVDYQINEFSKYNAKLAIDDFGMGSSNMQRLVKYPFSSAKLDMSLVWSYFKGENHIMEHVIQIFKDQNLTIVAEGVENKQMVEKLSEFSCEYLQGYYFSKPIAAHEFDLLVKKYNQ